MRDLKMGQTQSGRRGGAWEGCKFGRRQGAGGKRSGRKEVEGGSGTRRSESSTLED